MGWLVDNNFAKDRDQGVEIGSLLVDMGLIEHVCKEHSLRDKSLFYHFTTKGLVPPKVRDVISDAFLDEMLALINRDDGTWSLASSHPKTSTRVFASMSAAKHGLKPVKVHTVINAPPAKLAELLHDNLIQRHKDWNSSFLGGEMLQTEDDDCSVQVWRYATAPGINSREFVVAHRKFTRDDGTIVLIDRSVQHPDAPLGSKYVRSHLPYNVRVFTPVDDGAVTEFKYMNLTDLAGSIPTWVVNASNGSVSVSEIDHIRACVEKKQ